MTYLASKGTPEFLFCVVEGEFADLSFKHGVVAYKLPFIQLHESADKARRQIPERLFPSVFVVLTRLMEEDGYTFKKRKSDWILEAERIPPKYLRLC